MTFEDAINLKLGSHTLKLLREREKLIQTVRSCNGLTDGMVGAMAYSDGDLSVAYFFQEKGEYIPIFLEATPAKFLEKTAYFKGLRVKQLKELH